MVQNYQEFLLEREMSKEEAPSVSWIKGLKYSTETSQELMERLYPYRNQDLGPEVLEAIIDFLEEGVDYSTPRSFFQKVEYQTFMDYFLRKLSESKSAQILDTEFEVTFPCECRVRSINPISKGSKILRLKKPAEGIIEDLKDSGIENLDSLCFVDMSLKKCYYHRIHSPVDGKISSIQFFDKGKNMFGENNLWIVSIESPLGNFHLLLVGELSIQDFTFQVQEGSEVRRGEEIGNFNWGSQVVLLLDQKIADKSKIRRRNYFVGDKIV